MKKHIDWVFENFIEATDRLVLFSCVVFGSMLALWTGLDQVFGFVPTIAAVALYSFGIESAGNTVRKLERGKLWGIAFYVAMSAMISVVPIASAFGFKTQLIGGIIAGLFAALFTAVKALGYATALSENEVEVKDIQNLNRVEQLQEQLAMEKEERELAHAGRLLQQQEDINKKMRTKYARESKRIHGEDWRNIVDLERLHEGVYMKKVSYIPANTAHMGAHGRENRQSDKDLERLQEVYKAYEDGGKFIRTDVETLLGCSKSLANRVLKTGVGAGNFTKYGERNDTYYEVNGVSPFAEVAE